MGRSATFSADGAVGFVTLDVESCDLAAMRAFGAAVEAALGSDVRVVVVRSERAGWFAGGPEPAGLLDGGVDALREVARVSREAFRRITAAPQVFVAHLNGRALGAGLELALACDLRYASAGRYALGMPEVTLGLLPGNGGTQRLTRQLGPARALDLLLTGRSFGPDEALAWGLVSAVFPAAEAADRVRAAAERLATGPALALAAIKRAVHEGGELSLDHGLALELRLLDRLLRSGDALEGLRAYAEKRPPAFAGR